MASGFLDPEPSPTNLVYQAQDLRYAPVSAKRAGSQSTHRLVASLTHGFKMGRLPQVLSINSLYT